MKPKAVVSNGLGHAPLQRGVHLKRIGIDHWLVVVVEDREDFCDVQPFNTDSDLHIREAMRVTSVRDHGPVKTKEMFLECGARELVLQRTPCPRPRQVVKVAFRLTVLVYLHLNLIVGQGFPCGFLIRH